MDKLRAQTDTMGKSCFAILQAPGTAEHYGELLVAEKSRLYMRPALQQDPALSTGWWIYTHSEGKLVRLYQRLMPSSLPSPQISAVQKTLMAINRQIKSLSAELNRAVQLFDYLPSGRVDLQTESAREYLYKIGEPFLYPFFTQEHQQTASLQTRVDKVVSFLNAGCQSDAITPEALAKTLRVVYVYFDLIAFEFTYKRFLPLKPFVLLANKNALQAKDQQALTQYVQDTLMLANKSLGKRPFNAERAWQLLHFVYRKLCPNASIPQSLMFYKGIQRLFLQHGNEGTCFFSSSSPSFRQKIEGLMVDGKVLGANNEEILLSSEFPGHAGHENKRCVFSCQNRLDIVVVFPLTHLAHFLCTFEHDTNDLPFPVPLLSPLYLDSQGRYAILPRVTQRLDQLSIPDGLEQLDKKQILTLQTLQALLKSLRDTALDMSSLTPQDLYLTTHQKVHQLVALKTCPVSLLAEGQSNYLVIERLLHNFFPYHDFAYRQLAVQYGLSGPHAEKNWSTLFIDSLEHALLRDDDEFKIYIESLEKKHHHAVREALLRQQVQANRHLKEYLIHLQQRYATDLVEPDTLTKAICHQMITFHKIDGGGVRLIFHPPLVAAVALALQLRLRPEHLADKAIQLKPIFLIDRQQAIENNRWTPLLYGFSVWQQSLCLLDFLIPWGYAQGISNQEDLLFIVHKLQEWDRECASPLPLQESHRSLATGYLGLPIAEEIVGIGESANASHIYLLKGDAES